MKEFIQPVIDLVNAILLRKEGTKFLATVAALVAIYMMHANQIATVASDIIVGAIVAVYYVADIYYKTQLVVEEDDIETEITEVPGE